MNTWKGILVRWGALALLLLFYTQVSFAARSTSITLDEPLHIASGYACLATGDFRLVEEHPPLLKMLQAAPLLLADPPLPDPRTVPGWETGNLIEFAQHTIVPYRPVEPLLFASRVPTMLVGVILGALIFRWTQDVSGRQSLMPLLALGLFAFDPNMLAHAGVAATDLGAAAAIFAAMYCFARWLHHPTGARALGAALTLGMALGTKNTALMLGPIYALLITWKLVTKRSPKRYLVQGACIAGGAFLTLWGIYGFEFGPAPSLPIAIPAPSHLLPLLKLQEHMREGHSAFLMGQNYHQGDWRYFPIAFALKTPPLILLLCGITLIRGTAEVWRKGITRLGTAAPLLLFPPFYFSLSLTSGINIGYRHLLPILPFIYVIGAGYGMRGLFWGWKISRNSRLESHALRFITGLLLIGYVGVTLALFPWHLAYFNFFAGGPDGGYRYLVDSNLDWGQTWKALRRYLDAAGISDFYLSQYTINDPHAYGLDYTPLPPWPDAPPVLPQRFNPPAGVYAISINQLQGITLADPEMFDYFRHLEPTVRIGHAMFVYHLPAQPPVDWATQCSTPVVPLPADVLREGLGVEGNIPLFIFDCQQSWLVPPGEGRYVLARDSAGTSWTVLERGRLAYTQKHKGLAPPFAVYEWSAATQITPPVPAPDTPRVGEVLTFLGYGAAPLQNGERGMIVETWWRIEARPTQSLSLMAHLLGPDGLPMAIGDGLGVAVEQWTPGSLLIQRHRLTIPAGTPSGKYTFHTGAYTYPELERLPITLHDGSTSDSISVGQLEILAP